MALLDLEGSTVEKIDASGLSVERSLYLRHGFEVRRGANLVGVRVGGQCDCDGGTFANPAGVALDLREANVSGSIRLGTAKTTGVVRLLGARIGGDLDCSGAVMNTVDKEARSAVNAQRVEVEGTVFFNAAKVAGLELGGARIGDNLECSQALFCGQPVSEHIAIRAERLVVKNNLFIRSSRVTGLVRLKGATVGGQFDCSGSVLEQAGGSALDAESIRVGGSVFFRLLEQDERTQRFRATGTVNLKNARIQGALECRGGEFVAHGEALVAENIFVGGSCLLRKGVFRGVDLSDGVIEGQVDCAEAEFACARDKTALDFEATSIGGHVLLRRVVIRGSLNLRSTMVNGQLNCEGAQLDGEIALNGERMTITDHVLLRQDDSGARFACHGELRLLGARIGGTLHGDGGLFSNSSGLAVLVEGAKIGGRMLMQNGCEVQGGIRLNDISAASVEFRKATLSNTGSFAVLAQSIRAEKVFFESCVIDGKVNLVGAKVPGHFIWRNVTSGDTGAFSLSLHSAEVGTLMDDESSWPPEGALELDGLVYKRIGRAISHRARLRWIRLQREYRAQPYEQLASVLRASGHDWEARRVSIAKNDDYLRIRDVPWLTCVWMHVIGVLMGYGHAPAYTVGWIATLILVGAIVFAGALKRGAIRLVAKNGDVFVGTVSGINRWMVGVVYSLDLCIPFLNLHVEDRLQPDLGRPGGWRVRLYMWIHILIGWFLATLLVAGITGLIRK